VPVMRDIDAIPQVAVLPGVTRTGNVKAISMHHGPGATPGD